MLNTDYAKNLITVSMKISNITNVLTEMLSKVNDSLVLRHHLQSRDENQMNRKLKLVATDD